MKARDLFGITGVVDVFVNGEKDHRTHNMVVTAGKNWVASMMKADSTVMTTMQVGSGTTAEALTQTTLVTPVGNKENLTTSGGTVTDNVIVYECTFAAGTSTGTLNEAGIFNAGLTMLARTKFGGPITKGASDVVTIVWTITVS